MFFTFTSYVTPKHSSLICIRYFIILFGFSIQLSKYFIIVIIIIIIIIIISIIIITIIMLLFIILYYASLNKRKKEKNSTTHDVEIVCLTMEI